MSKHITAEQIAQYRSKSMRAADLLAFDRHVAQCEECRTQLAGAGRLSRLLSGLETAAGAPQHLSYDQMADYVDAKSDAVDREVVESHAELCERCAAELSDLAAFSATIPAPLASHSKGLGAISFSKKELRPKMIAGEDEENKKTR